MVFFEAMVTKPVEAPAPLGDPPDDEWASVPEALAEVRARLKELRPAGTVPVRLVAVSKTKPVAALMAAYRAGQVGATRPRATIARAPSAIASVTLETCRAGVARRSARSSRTTSRSSSKRPR